MFGGDPEAALIQYTMNEEARRAISSTEAVLNNRFIRVYWHRETSSNTTGQEQTSGSQGPGSVPGQGLQDSNMHKVSSIRKMRDTVAVNRKSINCVINLKELYNFTWHDNFEVHACLFLSFHQTEWMKWGI